MMASNLHKYLFYLTHQAHWHGFGIQSPTDFFLATQVIGETLPYYAYDLLPSQPFPPGLHYSLAVNRLLLRLANHLQPRTWMEYGSGDGSAGAYIQAGCAHARLHSSKQSSTPPGNRMAIDLLHIGHTDQYAEAFEECLPSLHAQSCCIIGHIHDTAEHSRWWKHIVRDSRTSITYDLYEVGLVFFDPHRYKQHYVVWF